jgi:hypothetical protein
MFLSPSLWRGLGHGTPRLIDVYPRFGRLHSFLVQIVRAAFVAPLGGYTVTSG